MKNTLLILVLLFCVTPCFGQTTWFTKAYYISQTGDDSAAGSTTAPWKSIQKCADTINGGEACIVKDGVYNENTVIISRSGSAGSPLYIGAENSRRAILNGRIVIKGSYVKINGFKIIPQPNQQQGVYDQGTYNQIVNCYIDGNPNILGLDNKGLLIDGQNSTADSNYITGTCYGIQIQGLNHVIKNNELQAMKRNGDCSDVDYIRFFGTGHVLKNNVLHGVDVNGSGGAHVDCFQTFDQYNGMYIKNIIIEGNYCSDAFEGIMAEGPTLNVSDGLIIRNNVFTKMYAWGVCAGQIKNIRILNNTFDMTLGIHGAGCGYGASCEFKNNIFYNGEAQYWVNNGATLIDGTAEAPGKNNIVYREGYTLTGYANDIVNKNPLFIDRLNGNFKLQNGSPAKQAGMVIPSWSPAPATDRIGVLRPQASPWTIGAYEYAEIGTTTTPTTTDTTTTPTTTDTTTTPTTTTTRTKIIKGIGKGLNK